MAIGLIANLFLNSMTLKKIALPFILFIGLSAFCYSQDFNPPVPKKDVKKPFWSWDRVYGGGGIGLQFGTFTLVNIAPDVGYKITDRYSAGLGIRYMYFADRRYSPPLESNVYGGSIFNRFIITSFLFAHAEYEVLNGAWDPYSTRRFNLNNMWVGGGLRQVAGHSSFNIMALWNVNQEPYNPFPNPQIRAGVSIGL